MPRRAAPVVLALVLVASSGWSEIPVGSEFQVNTYTTGAQGFPAVANGYASVATDAGGNFVVVWASEGQDGDQGGVFARRYSAQGTPLDAAEFQVNTYTTGMQYYPSVAASSGRFVVVWVSREVFNRDVFARLFDAAGNPAGAEFLVTVTTLGTQHMPSVAADAAGNFVVAWHSHDASNYGVFARRYDASGVAQGLEFQVNSYTTGGQYDARVAMDSAGDFVVVWHSFGQDYTDFDVFGQRFDAAGSPTGLEFQVNTQTAGLQTYPKVASDADGNFIVMWRSGDGSSSGVFGQRYDAAGTALGVEFRVNVETSGGQFNPAVASDANGNFVVVWYGNSPTSSLDTFGRWFDALGRGGAEFRLNSYTTGTQVHPTVAAGGGGRFVAVWRSLDQDGSGTGIFGQRFLSDLIFEDGFETTGCDLPPCGPGVSSVDYPVIAHGGRLVVTGSGFTGATDVTIGGVSQAFTVDGHAPVPLRRSGHVEQLRQGSLGNGQAESMPLKGQGSHSQLSQALRFRRRDRLRCGRGLSRCVRLVWHFGRLRHSGLLGPPRLARHPARSYSTGSRPIRRGPSLSGTIATPGRSGASPHCFARKRSYAASAIRVKHWQVK